MVCSAFAGGGEEAWCSAPYRFAELLLIWGKCLLVHVWREVRTFVQFWADFSQVFQLITPNFPSCKAGWLRFGYFGVMAGFAERRGVWIAFLRDLGSVLFHSQRESQKMRTWNMSFSFTLICCLWYWQVYMILRDTFQRQATYTQTYR